MRFVWCLPIFPLAFACGFGHLSRIFPVPAHILAVVPGWPGERLRAAFYYLTLKHSSIGNVLEYGMFVAHPSTYLGSDVRVGPYSLVGRCKVGDGVRIGAHVSILGGRHQHRRVAAGQIGGAEECNFVVIELENECAIGASSIVMAPVGQNALVRPGSVVVHSVPPLCVVEGNPARVVDKN
jgi:acetyltransferase-like isoleucine patch superfamily enzyme